jgi:hypothetical protein
MSGAKADMTFGLFSVAGRLIQATFNIADGKYDGFATVYTPTRSENAWPE